MSLRSLTLCTALTAGLCFAPAHSVAQPTGKVDIEALKREVEELKAVAASSETLAQAVQELSAKVVVLEQSLAENQRAQGSVPEAIAEIDSQREELRRLRQELEYLRTQVADIEQPTATSAANAERNDGMLISSEGGAYTLNVGGFMQARYQAAAPEDFSTIDEATFRLRRTRLRFGGQLGDDRLSYLTQLEFSESNPLLDYYMQMRYSDALSVRVGQDKVPFTRSFLAESRLRAFHELSLPQDMVRYDRDIGVWLLGSHLDGRLHYHVGASNGAGSNRVNDNIDLLWVARAEAVVTGDYFAGGHGDVSNSDSPNLVVGAAVAHDLVRLPANVAGIEVGNRDVDNNLVGDNVRVVSTVVDAQLRYRGWDLAVEGTWRHERWGRILEHADNAALAAIVDPSSKGTRNYLGFSTTASYFVLPKRLLVGGRVSHGRLPVLRLGGRPLAAIPLAERALQFDAIVQLYRDGFRRIGASYSLTNFNALSGADPAGDIRHAFVLEAQLVL